MKYDPALLTNRPEGNDARIGWSDADLQRSIVDRFERIVRQYPQRCAVNTGKLQLTYEELNRTANRLAGAIIAVAGTTNEPVAVLIDEPGTMIPAIVGILKAGKIYVPLDAESSDERLRAIFEDCQAKCIVTNGARRSTVERVCGPNTQVINTDELDGLLSTNNLELPLTANTLSSIIYTSGSTGTAKGVLEDHKYILRTIRAYSEDVGICPEDNLILLFSLSSNGSFAHLFGPLLNGATSHCPNLKKGDTARLARWLREENITIYYSSASLFRTFIETLEADETFPQVRVVQLSAEPVLPKDVQLCRKHFSPQCVFINRFASVEAGPLLQYKTNLAAPFTANALPAGLPVTGVRVYLIDDNGLEIGPHTTGQMVVQSRYLSLGYWNKPELTRTRFLPDPTGGDERIYLTGDLGRVTADGCFFHVGRKDFQIKIRGYRVDTGEVENLLLAHPSISRAAVVGQQGKNEDTPLVAFYVPAHDARLTETDLRTYLRERVPEYMIPSALVKLDALPTTPTGKVDRRALPSWETLQAESATSFVAPRTAVEETLAAFWMETLKRERVGIHDNFFDLGGDSLTATQIIARVWNTFGVELPIRSFFDVGTVATMVEQIERTISADSSKETMLD